MTTTLVDIEGELYESAAIVRAARDALPDIPNGNELADTVSLLCAVEKKLELLPNALQELVTTKGKGEA